MVKLLDGYTLMHEHIFIDLSGPKKDMDCRLDDFQATVDDLKELYSLGVRNILEVTNLGMGRNVEYMEEVAGATGMNIIYSTGFYKDPFLPHDFGDRTDRDLSLIHISEPTRRPG